MSRAVLVTGAGRGIGRAIAQRLADDGCDVLACDLEPDADGPGVPHAADLSTREGNRDAVAAALERFGRLDAVVANASLQHVAVAYLLGLGGRTMTGVPLTMDLGWTAR